MLRYTTQDLRDIYRYKWKVILQRTELLFSSTVEKYNTKWNGPINYYFITNLCYLEWSICLLRPCYLLRWLKKFFFSLVNVHPVLPVSLNLSATCAHLLKTTPSRTGSGSFRNVWVLENALLLGSIYMKTMHQFIEWWPTLIKHFKFLMRKHDMANSFFNEETCKQSSFLHCCRAQTCCAIFHTW